MKFSFAALAVCALGPVLASLQSTTCSKYQAQCEQQAHPAVHIPDDHEAVASFRQTYRQLQAEGGVSPLERRLKVGVYNFPPFVILRSGQAKDEIVVQEGFAVDIWEKIANATNTEFEYVYVSKADSKQALTDGRIDMVGAGMMITAERMNDYQFTVPFWFTGLNALVLASKPDPFMQLLGSVSLWTMINYLLLLGAVLGSSGLVFYLVEKKRLAADGVEGPLDGLFQGAYWSAVTITTVGYGDEYPKTLGGKIYGICWVVISMFIFASLQGSISSSITIASLADQIHDVNSLSGFKLGAIENSFAMQFLQDKYGTNKKTTINQYTTYIDLEEAVASSVIDAAIGIDSTLAFVATKTTAGSNLLIPGMPTHLHGLSFGFNNKVPASYVQLVSGYMVKPGFIDALVDQYFMSE